MALLQGEVDKDYLLPVYFFFDALNRAQVTVHGPHQLAQKSRNTTLSLNCRSETF
jgi:hypothetical protein